MADARKVCILLNRNAGTAQDGDISVLAADLAQPFRDRGDDVEIRVAKPQSMANETATLKDDKSLDIIVLGGGDGTLSRCADDLSAHPAALGFLPLGTMNLFARALGLPTNPTEAADVLANGDIEKIDIAQAGDRKFLHHISFGLHPKLINEREKLSHSSRFGKITAGVRALFAAIQKPPKISLELEIDGKNQTLSAPGLVISNNPFGSGHMPYQDRLTTGELGIYICSARDWTALTKASADAMLGRFKENPDIEFKSATAIKLSSKKKRGSIRASIDGELLQFSLPAEIKILPGSLKALVPGKAQNAAR